MNKKRNKKTGLTYLFCAAFLGIVIAWIVDKPGYADPPEGEYIAYQDIAAQLVTRGQSSVQGIVEYRHYKFSVQPEVFDSLEQLLTPTQEAPSPTLLNDVQGWLDGNLPATREAWAGICWFTANQWIDYKFRIEGVDTMQAYIDAMAAAAGMQGRTVVRQVLTHSDGITQTTIEDESTVLLKDAMGPMPHPMMPVDITLAPWQAAIDVGANIPNQEIYGSHIGNAYTIRYQNNHAGGSWSAVDYTFNAALDWAPTSLVQISSQDSGSLLRTIYGYAAAAEALMRPSVVAKGTPRDDGAITTELWIVDNWQETCPPEAVALIKPLVYFELDFRGNAANPVTSIQEPEYLDGIEPCDKCDIAVGEVIENLGTNDLDTDYNRDGIVDMEDVNMAEAMYCETHDEPGPLTP